MEDMQIPSEVVINLTEDEETVAVPEVKRAYHELKYTVEAATAEGIDKAARLVAEKYFGNEDSFAYSVEAFEVPGTNSQYATSYGTTFQARIRAWLLINSDFSD